ESLSPGPDQYSWIAERSRSISGQKRLGHRQVELDASWPLSEAWVQVVRTPDRLATVCIDGYLTTNMAEEDERTYRRFSVQHLALFVPWQNFTAITTGDINDIWTREKQHLPRRLGFVVDNIQLLHRCAQDVQSDIRQWAESSGRGDPTVSVQETAAANNEIDENDSHQQRQSSAATVATRLVDVFRRAASQGEVTARSPSIISTIQQLTRFLDTYLDNDDELSLSVVPETSSQHRPISDDEIQDAPETPTLPTYKEIKVIQQQQRQLSREREQHIRGIQQRRPTGDDNNIITKEPRLLPMSTSPGMEVDVGHRPSFREAGVNVAASLSLNERQSLALQMVCRKLDEVREDEVNTEQLLLFIGGEGGTGKSRVIEALAAVFNELDESHRLLVTATSGTAAANIDGITIHSACHLSQNNNRRQPATLDNFGATAAQTSRMDGEVKAEWRNRWLLVLDEVSMLGGATLSAINSSMATV
ncbi:DNA repair and recombination protein, partial [Colletotrichum musicola]